MALVISKNNHYYTNYATQTNMSLEDFIKEAHVRYENHKLKHPEYSIPFESEDLCNAILDWYGMMGEFSKSELRYLEEIFGLTIGDIKTLIGDDGNNENFTVEQVIHNIFDDTLICVYDDDEGKIVYEDTAKAAKKGTLFDAFEVIDIETYTSDKISPKGNHAGIMINAFNPKY